MSMGFGNIVYADNTLTYSVSSNNITASSNYTASFSINIPEPAESYCCIEFAVSLPSGASIDNVTYSSSKGSSISHKQAPNGVWGFSRFSDANIFEEQLTCTVNLTYTAKSSGTIVIEEIKQIRTLISGKDQEGDERTEDIILGGETNITINPYTGSTSSYRIAVGSSPQNGGAVTGDGEYSQGAEVKLTATPSSNYRFVGWYEDNVSISTSNPYTFSATSNRTIIAHFEYIGTGGGGGGNGGDGGSTISPSSTPSPESVVSEQTTPRGTAETPSTSKPNLLLDKSGAKGYISGYPDGTFRANGNLTRYETVAMFYNLISDTNKSSYKSEVSRFSDVGTDQWYSEAVGYLVAADVISGYPDGTFKGDNTINRAEFATIASKFGELKLDGNIPFTDVDSGHWAYNFIKSAFNNGWVSGYPDGSFGPGREITRAEAVVIINKTLGWDSSSINSENRFADIVGNEWYYNDVLLASNGKQQ